MFFSSFVDEETNIFLMAEVTEEELKDIFFIFQKEKSLGSDGWMIEFFQFFFDFISHDILQVVEEYHAQGHLHSSLNDTFIFLFQKRMFPSPYRIFVKIPSHYARIITVLVSF